MIRHGKADRPTSEAIHDKLEATEIYQDVETGYYVFLERADELKYSLLTASTTPVFAPREPTEETGRRRVDGCVGNVRISPRT